MIILLKTAAALMFALIALPASAAGCQDAVSLIDRTVCNTPDLNKLDADLNRLYSDLRTRLTAAQRSALLTQQRAWLVVRNRECATAAAECLHAQYAVRVDQLEALHASYTAAEGKLDDLTPVMVTGSWKVTSIVDPAGAGNPAKMDVQSSLDLADLPAVGAVVKTQPGKICLPAQACGAMGWYRKRLAEVNSSNAIAHYLKLDKTTEVLVGSSGAKESYYLLVPQRDGSAWAVFTFCNTDGSTCRQAAEIWTPQGPDSLISPRPQFQLHHRLISSSSTFALVASVIAPSESPPSSAFCASAWKFRTLAIWSFCFSLTPAERPAIRLSLATIRSYTAFRLSALAPALSAPIATAGAGGGAAATSTGGGAAGRTGFVRRTFFSGAAGTIGTVATGAEGGVSDGSRAGVFGAATPATAIGAGGGRTGA